MAKRGGPRGDVDSIRNALRPRMLLQGGGGASTAPPASTTIAPHHHHASEIVAEPETETALLSGDDVQEDLEELGVEKLARSGEQPMLGPLDMNHYSVDNVDDLDVEGTATVAEDVVFSGVAGLAKLTDARELTFKADAEGEAEVNNVRQVHLVGDDAQGEARLDGAERIEFNDEPTKSVIENPSRVELNVGVVAGVSYTAAEGLASWDSVEGALIAYVASGAGVVLVALGWTAQLAVVTGGAGV